MANGRQRTLWIRKGRLDDQESQEAFDRAFWRSLSGEERVAALDSMCDDYLELRGLEDRRLPRVARRVR